MKSPIVSSMSRVGLKLQRFEIHGQEYVKIRVKTAKPKVHGQEYAKIGVKTAKLQC